MPTVYQRRKPDGTLAKTFTADIWINGKKFPRSTGCKTRRDAEKKAIAIEAQLRRELASQHEPLTLDSMMAKYWDQHAAELPSSSSVKYHIARLLDILGKDKPLAELSNKDVNQYVNTRKKMLTTSRAKAGKKKQAPKLVSPHTINRELDVLQAAYIRARDLWEHPVRPIKWGEHRLEKPERGNHTLSAEETLKAVQLAKTKSRDMADAIELSYYTGVRQKELQTIIPARVSLADRKMVVLAKRKARQEYRERTVFLSTAAVALLAERMVPGMDPNRPIFNLSNGRKIWEWVRAQIGRTDVRWHDLRHTHASMLGKITKDPLVVKQQLGHTQVSTSMDYIHTENAQVLEGVEAIPRLTDRKVVLLRPDAENSLEPPTQATNTGRVTGKGA
jgi:integrase